MYEVPVRKYFNPSGTYKPPEIIKLRDLLGEAAEAAPSAPLSPLPIPVIQRPKNEGLVYLKPIGEDFETTAKTVYAKLPKLTVFNLNHLLLWKKENYGGRVMDLHINKRAVIKVDGKMVETTHTYGEVDDLIRKGKGGIDKAYAGGMYEYIRAQKPELTPAVICQILRDTQAYTGSRRLPHNVQLWTKDAKDNFVPSLYTMTEFNTTISNDPEKFGCATLSEFRKMNNFPVGALGETLRAMTSTRSLKT